MQIPNFQPQIQPGVQDRADAPSPIRSRRASVDGLDGKGIARSESGAIRSSGLEAIDSAETLDAVEISPLSRIILGEAEVDSRVETLEKRYNSGTYSVNPEQLAKSIVRVFLESSKSQGSRSDANSKGQKHSRKA